MSYAETFQKQVEDYGSQIRKLYEQNGASQDLDFLSVQEFAFKHGMYFGTNKPLLDCLSQGEKKQCFTNATQSFMEHEGRLVYVEGVAASESLGLTIHHAWLVDESGNVYDETWDYAPGVAHYYGVPFADEYVWETMSREGYYGIISPTSMFNKRLVTGKDKPEAFLHEWFRDRILTGNK